MIQVDLQSLVPHSLLALLGPEFVTTVLDDVATAARAKWIRLAQQQLGSSKRDYINGIQPISGSGNERVIVLVGQLPNMIEQGVEAWDLRTTLLGGGKGKTSRDGHRYRAIPFRHGTPGSKGQAGTPMGARYGPQGGQSLAWASAGRMDKGQAAAMGRAIHSAAKRLRAGERLGHDTLSGRTVVDLGRGKARQRLQVPKLAPWHKTDIFAGMQRTPKKYQTATQSQYTTFRTISEANPTGWIHPGIQARNLHQEVERHVETIMSRTVATAIQNALKEMTR
jgi:hypothetical protein